MTDRYAKYTSFDFDYPAERVLRVTLNRPETYNSLDAVGHREFIYLWRDIDDDPDISAVILTGKGKAFSSGGDFSMIEDNIKDPEARARAWKEARDLVYNIINCNKPIISAINGVAVGVQLPQRVTFEVVETEPAMKGQTASSSYKPAKLSNGARVMVPPHIQTGTRIVIQTEDGAYVERAKD